MPIDQQLLGPMLDTFKGMAADCTAKGYSGENYDKMMTALHRMEQLGQEMDDFMAFSAKMTTENLQMNFSMAYGQVISEAATSTQGEDSQADTYDDGALLKQTLDALKNAVTELKKGTAAAIAEGQSHHTSNEQKELVKNEIETLAKTDLLVAPIEALITYGESGINFPTFLRVQIEKGLDKAMEGSAVLREGIAYELDFAKAAAIHPYAISIKEKQAQLFDDLASQAKFGVPNSLTVSLNFNAIEASSVAAISKWVAIQRDWQRLFSLLDTWAIAHTRFAPHIEPWSMAPNPSAAVQKDKETLPGIIQERARLLQENYGIKLDTIFSHETFRWDVEYHHFPYSQTYTETLLHNVYSTCRPGHFLDGPLITEIERLYENKEMPNPENHKVLDRQERVYNQHFGEGNFEKKYGAKPDFGVRNAAHWSIS